MQCMKKLKIILLFSLVLYVIFIIKNNIFFCHYDLNTKKIQGIIISYKIDGNYLSLIIKGKSKIKATYYFKSEKEVESFKKDIRLGDTYLFNGTVNEISENSNFNLFNYRRYLYSTKIYYIMQIDNMKLINRNKNVFFKIKNTIKHRVDNFNSRIYLNLFILGENNTNDEIKESYQNNGISHLFAISGMHITLFTNLLSKILNKIMKKNKSFILITIFLLFYLFLTNYTPSVIRATFMYILLSLKNLFKLKIKSQSVLLSLISLLLIYNPYYIYNTGFLFSFIVSFSLIIFNDKINRQNSKIMKIFITSLISFIVGIPIMINNYHSINLLTPFINIIFVPFISIALFPLSLITFLIPTLDSFLKTIICFEENLSIFINNYFNITITLKHISIYIVIIYYLIIYFTLKKLSFKSVLLLLIIVTIHSNINYLDRYTSVNMIDVGQGDSILIKLPHNKGNILIDTGGKVSYTEEKWKERKKYMIAKTVIIPYLKSLGIKKLDYLILSHGDFDHMGEAINLVNNFKVDNVIFNCGEFNDLEKQLIKILKSKNIEYYSCINKLNIDKYKLHFLNTKEYDNENDNSNVIYFNYNDYKFLFMGDAGIEKEKDILNRYNINNIDVLKVGHHGSKTSSSKEFIDAINPKYSIISVGKNNRYGHPKNSVLNILDNSKLYRTDLDGGIEIKLNKNGYKIRTCSS